MDATNREDRVSLLAVTCLRKKQISNSDRTVTKATHRVSKIHERDNY